MVLNETKRNVLNRNNTLGTQRIFSIAFNNSLNLNSVCIKNCLSRSVIGDN